MVGNRKIKVVLLILCFLLCIGITVRLHPLDTISISFVLLIIMLCISGVFVFSGIVSNMMDCMKYIKQRWLYLNTNSSCYKLTNNVAYKMSIYIGSIIWTVFLLSAMVATAYNEPAEGPLFAWSIYAMCFTQMAILEPLILIKSLTRHLCITDRGFNYESVVAQMHLSNSSWKIENIWPTRSIIPWEWVQRIDVQHNSRCATCISKIIIRNANKYVSPIVISGRSPDIHRIIQDMQRYVPDKFNTP